MKVWKKKKEEAAEKEQPLEKNKLRQRLRSIFTTCSNRYNEKMYRIYGISEELSGNEDSIFRAITLTLKKRYLPLLLMTAIIFVGSSAFFYSSSGETITATMMLNYEESSKGMVPNETRFNIADFTNEEVMKLAIEKAALKDVITPKQLASTIYVYATTNREPVDERSYYIPTSYMIYYTNPKVIKDISASDMLRLICNAYSEFFHDKYTMNPGVLNGDYEQLNKMEYTDVSAYINMRINQICRYMNMRSAQSGKFKSSGTGETFNSIKKLAENVKNYALTDFNAYIWENGVVFNGTRYHNTLDYLNTLYERYKTENYNEYNIRKDVIGYFSTAMSTSILIPTRNKDRYYMARTRTGVDYLASDADMFLATAESFDLMIAKGGDKINKISSKETSHEREKADGMITSMKEELLRIEKLAVSTDKEFTNKNSKNYITFQIKEPMLTMRIPFKQVGLITLAFFMLVLFIFYKECSHILKRGEKN